MVLRSNVVAVLSTFALLTCAACGGGAKHEAKGPEGNPWADYKGTYASAGAPRTEPAASSKAEKATKVEAKAKDAAAEKAEKADKPEEAAPKKPSHGTIKGESVSSIGLDAFADASRTAMKSKVVSTKFVVGPQYEEMQVQLKGASVQVIRPAANPASDGPAITSPKARTGELSKATDSSWYDEEADVLVVVTAAKKPVAQKALGSILKK